MKVVLGLVSRAQRSLIGRTLWVLFGDVEVISSTVKNRNRLGVFGQVASTAKFFAATNRADSLDADDLAKLIARLLDCRYPQPVNRINGVTRSRFGFPFRRIWCSCHSAAAIQRFPEWTGWRSTVPSDFHTVFVQISIRPTGPHRLSVFELTGVSLCSRSLQRERILFRWSIFGSFNAAQFYRRFCIIAGRS